MFKKYLFSIFFLFTSLFADPLIELRNNKLNLIDFKMQYYIDTTSNKDYLKIKNKEFITIKNKKSFGKSSANIWFKLTLKNLTDTKIKLLLYNSTAFKANFIQYVELKNNKLINKTNFDLLNSKGNKELLDGTKSIYRFTLLENEQKTIYIQNINYGYNYVEYLLFDEGNAQKYSEKEQFFISFPMGFLISFIMFNLMLFIVLRYVEYLYYSLYLISGTIWMFYSYGALAQYFEVYDLRAVYMVNGMIGIAIFLSLFVKKVFNTKEKYKFENLLLNSLITVALIMHIFTFIDIFSALQYLDYASKYTIFVLFLVGVMILFKGDKTIKYFLIGHVFFVAFCTLASLFYDGKIEYSFMALHSIGIGIILEAAFLSYMLSLRIKTLSEEKNQQLKKNFYDLQTAQRKLLESEKLSSLGALVAGVAHEVNTPLGVGVTGASHFYKITDDIYKKYQNNEMTKRNFEKYLSESKELSSIISLNLSKATDLIKSFKQVAVDQSSEEKRIFYLDVYLEDILRSMKNIIEKQNIKIDTNIPNIKINSYPGAFSQIFTNLIMNSMIHAFDEKNEGLIEIEAYVNEKRKLVLVYRDNGKGIDEKSIKMIYDPFYTTNRDKGGSGLGLHIVYNILRTKLNGVIKCSSQKEKGVEFIMSLDILSKK